jgi:hypothetical protein
MRQGHVANVVLLNLFPTANNTNLVRPAKDEATEVSISALDESVQAVSSIAEDYLEAITLEGQESRFMLPRLCSLAWDERKSQVALRRSLPPVVGYLIHRTGVGA